MKNTEEQIIHDSEKIASLTKCVDSLRYSIALRDTAQKLANGIDLSVTHKTYGIGVRVNKLQTHILNEADELVQNLYSFIFDSNGEEIKDMLEYNKSSDLTKRLIDSTLEHYKKVLDNEINQR